jgi:hypothetical protein
MAIGALVSYVLRLNMSIAGEAMARCCGGRIHGISRSSIRR